MREVMPEWKKVLSPMTPTTFLRRSGLASAAGGSKTFDMPCAMLMLAPMQVLQCTALYGGRAPIV